MCFFFSNYQMETSLCEFDAKLRLLRHEKLRLDWQLKQADLCQLTLYQELMFLQEFERTEESLQEKLNEQLKEESTVKVGDSFSNCGMNQSVYNRFQKVSVQFCAG